MTQHQSLGSIVNIPNLSTIQWAMHPDSQAEWMQQGSSDVNIPDRIEMHLQELLF